MSHIVTIKTELRDLQAIRAACKRLGWTFVEGQRTYAWYGRYMGDSQLPEGITQEELGHCDHAIRVPGASYEIGLKATGRGFVPLWDYWHAGKLPENAGQRLAQAYAIEKARAEARRAGHTVSERQLADGSVQLTINA